MSAIIVENLGKRYQIGHQVRHDTLRDALTHNLRRLLPRTRRGRDTENEDFWALQDVSFKVEPGEVVGIIGRNGAGKSTLLKILSRITEPTTGRVTLNGRVASLLEVGTGFHPELSGRENIFLNGAILGMSRIEIRRKFDEIVAFSEVEKFLDTPVKRYSSGMYVRLAFAVAAHLEPEILIVDEVLAVGDAQFQQKCLSKMQTVSSDGRTVLLVSHNMTSILALCHSCCILERGRLEKFSDPKIATDRYSLTQSTESSGKKIQLPFHAVHWVHGRTGDPVEAVEVGSDVEIIIRLDDSFSCERFDIVLGFTDNKQHRLMSASTHHRAQKCSTAHSRLYKCRITNLRFLPGSYRVNVMIRKPGGTMDGGALPLRVIESDLYGSGVLPDPNYGAFAAEQHWETLPSNGPTSP